MSNRILSCAAVALTSTFLIASLSSAEGGVIQIAGEVPYEDPKRIANNIIDDV